MKNMMVFVGLILMVVGAGKALGFHRLPTIIEVRTKLERWSLLDPAPRHIIVGIDVTDGREEEIDKDIATVNAILSNLRPGDRLDVYLIHGRSETSQESIFSATMPDHEGPIGQQLARAKQKAIASWEGSATPNIRTTAASSCTSRTDVVGFCRFVAEKREFRANPHPYLIMLTDAQHVGDGVNFERVQPPKGTLDKWGEAGRIPDLSGVIVAMAGVTPTHHITNEHWRALKTFWISFYDESGARQATFSPERALQI